MPREYGTGLAYTSRVRQKFVADFRPGRESRTLAYVPGDEESVADQLAALLDRAGVSGRELGKRITKPGGDREAFKRRWNAQTRWVQKVLAGEVPGPTARKVKAVEKALGVPAGTIKVPPSEPRAKRLDWRRATDRRLGEVEAGADRLVDAATKNAEAILALETRLADAEARITRLEGGAASSRRGHS